ncbi:MAG: CDP-alcohol phosphatidyltransferase family protein [Actinobacteria bacterium]|nr:CDP-alcohol phosphatidyltransferase family protein [Actinomycetota bacterium]
MSINEFFALWSRMHGDAKITGIVRTWLVISYKIAKLLSRLKFTPNKLTFLGLVFGVLLFIYAQSPWAPIFLIFSLICDGVDGSLAIFTSNTTRWGAILDSIIDRITEFFWILAIYKIGADERLLLVVIVIASIQEYTRARAGGLGMQQVGVVTFAERPVRASFIFTTFIAYAMSLSIINQLVIIWLLLQLISFFMIIRFTYLKLS